MIHGNNRYSKHRTSVTSFVSGPSHVLALSVPPMRDPSLAPLKRNSVGHMMNMMAREFCY